MPRATRSTPANRSPTRAAPAQQPAEAASSSSNSPKKRARPDASLDMPDALEAMEHKDNEGRVASAPRKTRRTGKAKQEDGSSVGQSGGGEAGEVATGESRSPLRRTRSSAAMVTDDEPAATGEEGSQASSSTLEQAQDGEVIFDGSGMSAEQRRKAKGKGKALEQDQVEMEDASEEDELTRLRKELAANKELMAQQQAALASVHSAIACAICTEPLDRPYSLQCGHVFCRKCLVTWFFRADPDEEDRQNAAEEQATGSSSSSSSSSDDEDDASSSSGSIHSHMGGHINGRAFQITGLEGADDESKRRLFEMGNEALLRFGFNLPGREAARNGRATSEEGGTEGSEGGKIVEIEKEDEEEEEKEEKEEKQLSRDELRQKRLAALARFGFDINVLGGDSSVGRRFLEVKDEEKGDEQPPTAGPSTSRPAPAVTTNASASTSAPRRPEPAASAAPPAPPKSPLKPRPPPPPVPTGAHRAKNLVCPSCRAICSEHSPNRVFVLDEIVTSLRRSNVDESGSIGSSAGAWRARAETAEDGWPAMDEADESWGGLFPGPGGKESASDRRRRLAQIVRDRDDGVRRCGECNWELDERTGICEGCGRRWDISDDDSDDDSNDGYTFGGLLGFGRHRLGRQHHDVELSATEDDSDNDSQPARAALYDSQESYESDFVVKSDEEEEQERERTEARLRLRREAVRRRRRRLEASGSDTNGSRSSSSSSASKSGSSSSEEDEDSDDERVARRRRRTRRQQGEVIDLDSDTDSDEDELQGSSDGTGDGSSGSDSDSGSERGGGRGFLDDEVSVKKSKKKRIILDSDDDDDDE
ncbi:Proteophosphoglycan ppg4 [Rhodotorula toruloides]|uniref:BY PROTMAP: gi/342319739/gb/EGU11686.1/ Proteophosphoglycan ppg4 [Rhodotorula glutinis ATCC 204091] n=1 Tax=Rhodotorula toruloides TaxID=5286 RepID=A0A0K3CFB6_RHOTO|nr:Proteophosphoglycan ppg4 [Rhodotorula toruloides]PRQ74620.1 hypothetical protein AAT19DRAFT_14973 [Rhodotorula toruloides]